VEGNYKERRSFSNFYDIMIHRSFLLTEKNQKVKTVRKNQKIQRFASLKFWNSLALNRNR